jgi:DNA polymerase/3'-5' exonuclease PolX
MDNKPIARVLRETAHLLEIDGAIIGRYRSYEKAAELIDGLPESIEQLVKEPEKLGELPGIGERMVEHLTEIVKTGDYTLRKKLLKKYPESILDVLQTAVSGTQESGVSLEEFQGWDCRRRKARKKRQAARSGGFWRKIRAKYSESGRSIQEINWALPY